LIEKTINCRNANNKTAGSDVATYIPDEVSKWFDAAIKQGNEEKLKLDLDFG